MLWEKSMKLLSLGTVVLSDVYTTREVGEGQGISGGHDCLPTLSTPRVLGGLPQRQEWGQ